jgi:hypothetical protein
MEPRSIQDLPPVQQERLAFIEFRVWFLGDIRRPDLIDRFGVSPAVSTRDLASYREIAPDNIEFDDSKKRYVPASSFKPVFSHDPVRVLNALSKGYGEGLGRASEGFITSEFPVRLNQPPLHVIANVTRAIHQKKALKLTYHSFSSGASRREIVPFALVDSGLRWHVRAYDRKSGEFRDLVITRMDKPTVIDDDEIQDHEQPDADNQWTRIVELTLVPHPDQSRPEIVARDFGMKGGSLVINVRAAVAGYVLQQWAVDCSKDHSLDPTRYRLWLKDAPMVLYGVQNAVLADGYKQNS